VNKDDTKALEALALASLPEAALIAKLAHKMVGKAAEADWFAALIRETYPKKSDISRLRQALMNETYGQEKIHNERQAIRGALSVLARPYTERCVDRNFQRIRHAQLQFGGYVKSVFASDILALMELTSQDCRSYRVTWLDCSVRPAISALIKVTVDGKSGVFEGTFLLYKAPGTSTARAVTASDCIRIRDAWAYQVPSAAMMAANLPGVRSKRTDFADQAIVIIDAAGDEQRFPWVGKSDL
jgi:hypothetical protein